MTKTKCYAGLCAAILSVALLSAYSLTAWAAPSGGCASGRHQYKVVRRAAPTAETDGEAEYLCAVCGQAYLEVLYATAHVWGEWETVRKPDCVQPGERRRTCARGQRHDEYAAIPPLGHKYTTAVTEPGCEEEGAVLHECGRCGHSYTETISPVWHDYEEAGSQEAECLEPGVRRFVCKNNPEHTYEEITPAYGSHSYGAWRTVTPAGEGAQGSEARVCGRCGLEQSRGIDALPVPTPAPPAITPADVVLVGANAVSLGYFGFLLLPYILGLLYIRRRQKAVRRRNELRREVEKRYGFE